MKIALAPFELFCQTDIKRVSFDGLYSSLETLIEKTVRALKIASFFYYSVCYIIKQMSIKLEFNMAFLIQ